MDTEKATNFRSLTEKVGRFILSNKIILIPEMNRIGSHLLAASLKGFGIDAKVMDTYLGLDLGKEYTSGKECFPCQITTGDILYFMQREKDRLGDNFNSEDYVYFMPEANGPCRFGMYSKYQRIVLDSFPELKKLKIGSLSAEDSYTFDGMVEDETVGDLRKVTFWSIVVADILERLLWRIRPYENEVGVTDKFIEKSMHVMADAFESYGAVKDFEKILSMLGDILKDGKTIIDRSIPPKPLVGIVGEIYLRSHTHANQDLIRVLEKYGAEVVNASVAEWVNYTTYNRIRNAGIGFNLSLRRFQFNAVMDCLKKIIQFGGELFYQQFRQNQLYKRARTHIDLAKDHRIAHLEKIIKKEDLFSFDIGTEACLSIAAIVEHVREGYNGVVNVYPFTCMPSMITSTIVKPLMNKQRIPYLDTPYDGSFQPGGETAIRTFMYQANQHFKKHGRKKH